MGKDLTEMVAEIAKAQASHAIMSAEEVEDFLKKTFDVLKGIKAEEEEPLAGLEGKPEAERMDPQKSIQRNKVICLECGKEFKLITNRHLKEHGMDLKEYRKKHGFSARQALAAKTLTAKRRKAAKELGLGENLKKARLEAKAAKAKKKTKGKAK